ncbi:MAG: hypothetical protein AAFZ18_07560 [Myxococcota bacterium]
MRKLALIIAAGLAPACTHHNQYSAPVTEAEYASPGRCGPALDAVAHATHPEAAEEATSRYLSCVATWDQNPPPDLEEKVAGALHRNVYPQTRRDAKDIIGKFFDADRLRELPENRRELVVYRETLDAQILRAQAQRDTKFVAAAEKRAQNLAVLTQVLEAMDERE